MKPDPIDRMTDQEIEALIESMVTDCEGDVLFDEAAFGEREALEYELWCREQDRKRRGEAA